MIPAFKVGTNPSESWRQWKEDLEALRYSEAPEEIKTALFRHLCGEELKKQTTAFDLKPNDGCKGVTLQQVLQEFDKYFLDYQNDIFASFKFLEIKQEQREKITDYYSRLRNAVVECNYGKSQDRMLRDKIIQGLLDKALQERFIRETSKKAKTLQEVVSECKTAENSKLSQTSVNYLGHVLSDKGITPDPKKIRAIEEFATLNCKEDLQRFLGMVTYLAKFTSHLSNLTHNLKQFLKKDYVWIWDTNTERDFELVKQVVMKSPCLKYFDGNKAVTVSVDASKNGLGAMLLQEDQPVADGSVSLTQTQQRYAQSEEELMAVIYELEHFNYIYIILMEGLSQSRQITSQYQALLEYIPGKDLVVADALSRAQSTTDNFDEVLGQEATVRINLLTQVSPTKWEEIASLTAGDPEMQDVLFHINNGWPQKKKTKIAAQP
ncbi:retrovirus-related Pol polyprotein from transposon 17.6 [Trichonephila inaurata madagascariensis]|uniref:Retrovirus-related Pol polyprotein from transposon 17.6 n=1 Tax=Trichonephila inaurata madagascariensis TaxID=2747483 RepID=A0A8X7C112_9ARAC|nr:retrovirus-related Pol polyprotein from transposon 17.6 [Trichonephila inaurata madagascariensis]